MTHRLLLSGFLGATLPLFAAATVSISNADGPGEGFNDPTVIAPVGGNTGTSIGQQRLNVFQAAATIWGATLTSVPAILVQAQFNALTCSGSGAILGSAGPSNFISDSSGVTLAPANTHFHLALANKLAGSDLIPAAPEILTTFNSNLGSGGVGVGVGCGFTFYMGLDNNPPVGQIDLLPVILHELAHGLGFSTSTNGSTGAKLLGKDHKFDTFLFDLAQNLSWPAMTDTQRGTSALNPRKLVWTGANVSAAVPTVLTQGTPELVISAPATLAKTYLASAFQAALPPYPNLSFPGVTGEVMPASDAVAPFDDACSAITATSALGLSGKIAVIDRGNCLFNTKVANAAAAGAIGVIFINNAAGGPPPITGADAAPAIPSLVISQADGALLRNQLRFRSRNRSGIFATVRANTATFSGADSIGRALMFSPDIFQSGSSISHWDPSMFRSQLMEPNFSAGLTLSVNPPQDLSFKLLQDMGW